jgi:hypothetical protein
MALGGMLDRANIWKAFRTNQICFESTIVSMCMVVYLAFTFAAAAARVARRCAGFPHHRIERGS